ncbi:MAG: hypothetical protein RMZ69_18930 [Nostoc sp. ChiQUE01a]|nr:hypothetical protein [Nostoc sp. ChiQUE01a]
MFSLNPYAFFICREKLDGINSPLPKGIDIQTIASSDGSSDCLELFSDRLSFNGGDRQF